MRGKTIAVFALFFALYFGEAKACVVQALTGDPEEIRQIMHDKSACHGNSSYDLVIVPPFSSRIISALSEGDELTFTFDSPEYPWSAVEVSYLQSVISAAYPLIKEKMGNPFYGGIINVRRDPTISEAGVYWVGAKEIVLNYSDSRRIDLLSDVFIHETIHAFRGYAVIGIDAFEEGMTRALEVSTMNQLSQFNSNYLFLNHSYNYDVYYEGVNREGINCPDAGVFCGTTLVVLRYQISGYAWGKVYLEHKDFFLDFNRKYQEMLKTDDAVRYTLEKLLKLVISIVPEEEGMPMTQWLATQKIFQQERSEGCNLFQRISTLTFDLSCMDSGIEKAIPGVWVSWEVFDASGKILASGGGTTSNYGWTSIPEKSITKGYRGRISIVGFADSPQGHLESVAERNWPIDETTVNSRSWHGVFGVAKQSRFGTVEIETLDAQNPKVKVPLDEGAFEAPQFEKYAGRVRVTLTAESGRKFVRIITKDAAPYFVEMDDRWPKRRSAKH